MVKILDFNSDRVLGFAPNRSLWFDPNDGLWFNPDRDLSFDQTRDLPFGKKGIIFRGLQCSVCGNMDYHIESRCTKCGWTYTLAEFTKTQNPQARTDLPELSSREERMPGTKEIVWTPEETVPVERSAPRVKPKVAARAVPPQPKERTVAQPVSRVEPRSAPPTRPAPQPRQVHQNPPAQRPRSQPRPQVRRGADNAHCSSCGVRVSLRHPYCWNCSHPIRTGGQ